MSSSLDAGQKINLTDEQDHYLNHVMRLQNGDPVILFNGEGGEYNAVIHRPVKSKAVCHIEKHIPIYREMACEPLAKLWVDERQSRFESIFGMG